MNINIGKAVNKITRVHNGQAANGWEEFRKAKIAAVIAPMYAVSKPKVDVAACEVMPITLVTRVVCSSDLVEVEIAMSEVVTSEEWRESFMKPSR